MAKWERARAAQPCGGCVERIAADAPVCILRSGLRRCAACAKALLDLDPPAHLLDPAPDPPAPTAQPTVAAAPTPDPQPDVKQRQGGDI